MRGSHKYYFKNTVLYSSTVDIFTFRIAVSWRYTICLFSERAYCDSLIYEECNRRRDALKYQSTKMIPVTVFMFTSCFLSRAMSVIQVDAIYRSGTYPGRGCLGEAVTKATGVTFNERVANLTGWPVSARFPIVFRRRKDYIPIRFIARSVIF